MLFLKRSLGLPTYLIAMVLAAVLPMGTGYLIFMNNPGACYDSPCALPLLLMSVPLYAAPVLTVLFALNRRFGWRLPDGWIPATLFSACLTQIGISVFSVLMTPANIRDIFFPEILFMPQGFGVGGVVGLVFWVALFTFGRRTAEP